MLHWIRVPAVGLALSGVLLAGCASLPDGSATPGETSSRSVDQSQSPANPSGRAAIPPVSSTVPPSQRPPSRPPKTPTDVPPGWIVGTVTKGGTGPCYGMETDEGKLYALYGGGGVALERGSKVRVRVEPLKLKIYCGPGLHVHILEIKQVS
jgi:hypothetical protein